ncbi:hypothetical protein [Microvirga makkahensis]|uniref:Uncharacterized protein n=1 Tax=Microvirga makkahensis TaxID=1128670 RepID=A0A7X3SQ63_9HYPH|nr:hypothetical protein [Microvirga makkahensis]MXQ12844.1 hypothetical protein [Microvirga makkahensis]
MSRIRQVTKTGNLLIDGVLAAGNVWDMTSGPIKIKIETASGHNGDGGWFRAVAVSGQRPRGHGLKCAREKRIGYATLDAERRAGPDSGRPPACGGLRGKIHVYEYV